MQEFVPAHVPVHRRGFLVEGGVVSLFRHGFSNHFLGVFGALRDVPREIVHVPFFRTPNI